MPELVIRARRRSLGSFEVGRVLPYGGGRMVGPFIFLDHIGPLAVAPGLSSSADVRPHPHIGLATITYLLEGEITHRDSLGFTQTIRPAELNWMTAGRGISHSERFERLRAEGGRLHGLQAWVALPDTEEECEPAFEHYGPDDLAAIRLRGIRGHVIAGEAYGAKSRVRTRSPLVYAHLRIDAGHSVTFDATHAERAFYVVGGEVELDGRPFGAGNLLVLGAGDEAPLAARTAATVMLLGGEPVGPRHIWWNFVSSRRERIEQAKRDWREGRIPPPVDDAVERIPLPDDPPPPAEPMS
jgi:redox-sensitive bicupin YhaK (pirin superfamily)